MLDVKALEQVDYYNSYQNSLKNRGVDQNLLEPIVEINKRRKKAQGEFETLRAEQNKFSLEIAARKRAQQDASEWLAQMSALSEKIKRAEAALQETERELRDMSLMIPNHLHASVPIGRSSEQNQVVRTVGHPPKFSFAPRDHVELGERLGILDFERAGKIAGARFSVLRSGAAQLERALLQFMMDTHSRENGYEEMIPPFIVNSRALEGTGQFPKFKDDVFHLEGFDLHLVPTAEVPVTNFFAGEVLDEKHLPISFVAYTPCFRSEAGSYGRDTKGLIRQHQFNKVELLKFTTPEKSYEEHERLTSHAESILQKLELPYRVVALCSGDIGFSAAKCYDLEVWLPGSNHYREISSCSNFEDFQARRADIRFRPADKGKPRYVHTLNGSGLAIGRTLIAILENYQTKNGEIRVPEVLRAYMNRDTIRARLD